VDQNQRVSNPGLSKIKKYIHHTHIKDAKMVDGKIQYVRLGQGEVPIFEAIDAYRKVI